MSSLATRVCTNRRRNASSPLAASQRRAVHHTTTARGEPSARRHLASAPQVCVPYTNATESVISEHSHTHGRTHAHTGAAVVRATHASQQKVWRSRAPPTRGLLTVWRRYPGCTQAQSEVTHVSWYYTSQSDVYITRSKSYSHFLPGSRTLASLTTVD